MSKQFKSSTTYFTFSYWFSEFHTSERVWPWSSENYGVCYFPQQATIEWQRMSQTVGGLPTDPTTKEPQLGTIGRVGESVCDRWRLRMMLSAWYVKWKVQPLATTEGSSYRRVPVVANQEWARRFVRPERSSFIRTVPAWQLFCNTTA